MEYIERVKNSLEKNIQRSPLLSKNIVSIYGIGGIAKNKLSISDIDINIFIKNDNPKILKGIKKLLEHLGRTLEKTIDVNIVSMSWFEYNFANSDLFPHKNRHSLFLHELKEVKCLLYGEDILNGVFIQYSDMIPECVKLTCTLSHRLSKLLLTRGEEAAMRQAKKFARYACEFALIFQGKMNPYIGMEYNAFLEHYPEFNKQRVVKTLWNDVDGQPKNLYNYYALIVKISEMLKARYIKLVKKKCNKSKIGIGLKGFKPGLWFSFPNIESLNLFYESCDSIQDHKRIQ